MQTITSKGTSINKTKLPAIYNKIDWDNVRTGVRLLDIGCGRYTDHIKEFVESKGFHYTGYDPYWAPDADLSERYDIIICSNVLNVIDDDEAMEALHQQILDRNAVYFITVYEGDGRGIGRKTGKDTYQRNQKTIEYAKENECVRNKVITKPLWADLFLK